MQKNQEENIAPNIYYNGNKKNMIAGIVILLYEIVICALFSTVYGFNAEFFENVRDYGGMLLVSILTILMIVGFGLINSYVANSAFSGMLFTFIIYCITIQHFFLFRAFWNKAGANDQIDSTKSFDQRYNVITMSNIGVDRQTTTDLPSAAWVEGIACALALNVAISPVIGRIGLLQVFFLTIFGSFFYEVNSELMWRWFVTDTGYGYRIFIFGAVLGLVSTKFLGRKQTLFEHPNYFSTYSNMALGLLGFLILWCSFPFLCVAGVYTYTSIDNSIIYAAPLNMYLALVSGVLGTFVASAVAYRKFSVHDLIFTGLTGGIIFSSSSDVNWNPSVPLIVGFLLGFICSFKASQVLRRLNKSAVTFTSPIISRFLIPGIVAGILVAVLQGVGKTNNGVGYQNNYLTQRSVIGQGAFMILGIVVTSAIAALAGVIIGIFYKLINKHTQSEQYNDQFHIKNVPITQHKTL